MNNGAKEPVNGRHPAPAVTVPAASNATTSKPAVTRGPQRICILCDGTWQERRRVASAFIQGTLTSSAGNYLTNVALLAQAIAPASDRADENGHVKPQIVCYVSGVGTTLASMQNLLEGATGMSLDVKVENTYGFLCDNYLPGDEIFLFGFSRGAYTARALGGLINWAGILAKREMPNFPKLWKAYSRRNPTKPATDDEAAKVFHESLGRWPNREASQVSTVNAELGVGEQPKESNAATAPASPTSPISPTAGNGNGAAAHADKPKLSNRTVRPPPIKVIGVWDTVGALGVPGHFADPLLTSMWNFFDPGLGSSVEHGFHALGLQEDRKDFAPTFWYKQPDAPAKQVLRQVWFQGTHTDVGGGYTHHGLSDITLAWMVAQLTDAPGGSLLNVDLQRLRELQDRRAAWARQPSHQSRLAVEWQATRHVGQSPYLKSELDRVVWRNMVESGSRGESIHHSVIVGGKYNPETSAQFAELRKTDSGKERLREMWAEASKEDSLLPTERLLRWGAGEEHTLGEMDPTVQLMARANGSSSAAPASEIDSTTGNEGTAKSHRRHSRSGSLLASSIMGIAAMPERIVSSVVNFRPTPSENLKPGPLARGVESIRRKMARDGSKDTINQQIFQEST